MPGAAIARGASNPYAINSTPTAMTLSTAAKKVLITHLRFLRDTTTNPGAMSLIGICRVVAVCCTRSSTARCPLCGSSAVTRRMIQVATRVLVVEDDADIAELVARYLDKAGFSSEREVSGREALRKIAAKPPDALVLDLMLPHVDGL